MVSAPMVMKNEAMVLESIDKMVLQDYSVPDVGPDDCLIEMKSIGICGSDVHYWKHGKIGQFVLNKPMIIGHESAGVVRLVGSNVSHLNVGDKVALEPGVPCGKCEFCSSDKYNLCPEIKFFATPPVHGSLARYVSHPSKFCFKLPEGMSTEEGAMCEPLSVGVYACESKARVKEGSRVVIFGAGPIGMICAMVAKGLGSGKVLVCDIQEGRLELVKTCVKGVDTLNTKEVSEEEGVEKIRGILEGEADAALDCCGVESAVRLAVLVTKAGSVVCLVGMGCCEMKVPLLHASCREVDLRGVFRYRHTYPKCIKLLSSKKIDVSSLITHRFTFSEKSILDAFACCYEGKGEDGRTAVKCMINVE